MLDLRTPHYLPIILVLNLFLLFPKLILLDLPFPLILHAFNLVSVVYKRSDVWLSKWLVCFHCFSWLVTLVRWCITCDLWSIALQSIFRYFISYSLHSLCLLALSSILHWVQFLHHCALIHIHTTIIGVYSKTFYTFVFVGKSTYVIALAVLTIGRVSLRLGC